MWSSQLTSLINTLAALYYSIDNRNILGMTTLTHVYVRRANFITKLRFEIVELRSFA